MTPDEKTAILKELTEDLMHAAYVVAAALESLQSFDSKDYWEDTAAKIARERGKIRERRRREGL
jgi:hypothetical protein